MRKLIIAYLKEQYENAVRGVAYEKNRIDTDPYANTFGYTVQSARRNAFKEVLDYIHKLEEGRLGMKYTRCPSCKYSDHRDVDRCWDCETGFTDGFEQKDADEIATTLPDDPDYGAIDKLFLESINERRKRG